MKAWTVELRPVAARGLRALEEGPRQAAIDLLKDLAEDPDLIPALELRGKPDVWRARFHADYRMIYQIAKAQRRIIVTRIEPRATAYEGMGN